jgi:hypothetical protein
MKVSKRVHKVIWVVLVTTLLLVGGLAAAQNSNPKAWGRPVDGLQMRVSLNQAEGGQSKSPKFRIELRNAGEKDLLLNLGIMTRNGGQQYPTAVSLILLDAQGKSELLELKRSLQVSDAGRETLYLPLPVGAIFSVPVDLNDYWTPTSKEFYTAKPGTYSLAAQFNRVPFPKQGFRLQSIGERSFDMVNPEAGGPPTSNTLQFEVSSR